MNQLELKKVIRPVILIVALMIAVYTIVHLWNYYNAAPWTRDGRVRGDVIQVSSDVAGLVTEVLVQDNQTVKKGQVLFKIDVSRRALDVEQAKSDLAKAKAAYAQAQAGLAQAKANLIKSSTNIKLAEKNANRYSNLMDGAISKQEQDQVFATRDQSHAEHEQLQAAIQQANADAQAKIESATSPEEIERRRQEEMKRNPEKYGLNDPVPQPGSNGD